MAPHIATKLYDHRSLFLLFFVLLTYSTCHAVSGSNNRETDALPHSECGSLLDRPGLLESCGGSSPDCNNPTYYVLRLPGYETHGYKQRCLEGTVSQRWIHRWIAGLSAPVTKSKSYKLVTNFFGANDIYEEEINCGEDWLNQGISYEIYLLQFMLFLLIRPM